jgi:hypothetical protein
LRLLPVLISILSLLVLKGSGSLKKYMVTSFDSGYHRVDPVYAELAGTGGIKRYYSDYSVLEVARAAITPPDSAEIFDIEGPYRAPFTAGEVMPWALLAL